MTDVSYILPIRRFEDDDPSEITAYLRALAESVELVIVDGSDEERFSQGAALWSSFATHIRPHPQWAMHNGKAWGVHTGMAHASYEYVVIADDDVRYSKSALAEVVDSLRHTDLVRPQNYFDPMPWHAAWDTARSLINRAFHHDSPGTLGVRRSFFRAMGGYDGNVLYENCELVRTVAARDGRIAERPDIYVRRRPPEASRFWGQRRRQAYDDFAQPLRMTVFLAAGPGLVGLSLCGLGWLALAVGIATPVCVAAVGRQRHGGAPVFPVSTIFWAPIWAAERMVCSWLAVFARARGGMSYGGRRLRVAAHSIRRLRRRRLVARI